MYRSGINQDNAQQMNRELVLRFLRKNKVCSRIELAKLTNLNPATITNIINDFQKIGIVEETGAISEGKGRSAIGLTLSASKYSVIGIRLARKYMIIGAFDIRGEQLKSQEYAFEEWMSPGDVLEAMKMHVHEAINEWISGEVTAIGCAVPGPFLCKEGRVALMTGFLAWQDINIQEELEKEFNLPVFMENDANAGAIAYYWKYGTELKQSLVYVAVGQGVGAGVIEDGSLLAGKLGVAGEIGHMSIDYNGRYCECGSRGCLETYCSTLAFSGEVKRRKAQGNYSIVKEADGFKEIVNAVRVGDRLAVDEYRHACECLTIGIVNIINMLNPDTIVIDDEMVAVEPEILKNILQKGIKQAVLPIVWQELDIVIGDGTQESMLQGAAFLAIEEIMKIFARK